VLTSKKNILVHAGTVLVLEVKNIPRSFWRRATARRPHGLPG